MKYRLVVDNYASTADPWYLVQRWEPPQIFPAADGRWALVSCGLETAMRKLYERLTSEPDKGQYTVVEQSGEEPKSMFKAREAKEDLGL